jgi:hypothetical protein
MNGDAGTTPTLYSNINNHALSKKLKAEGWGWLGHLVTKEDGSMIKMRFVINPRSKRCEDLG